MSASRQEVREQIADLLNSAEADVRHAHPSFDTNEWSMHNLANAVELLTQAVALLADLHRVVKLSRTIVEHTEWSAEKED